MRVRIALTDGVRTADYAWLRYSRKQVVCGVPENPNWHLTYPADGRAHYTIRKRSRHVRRYLPTQSIPLITFSGQRELLQVQLASPAALGDDFIAFEHQPQDVVAYLDLRAFPKGRIAWTALGLIEPGKADQLQFSFEVYQLLLVTRPRPWLYIAAGAEE